jgi:predicted DNA-binding protein YlxM (UPF0122 family)
LGRVKIDIYKSEITHDVVHAYTNEGIAQLLEDVYKLANDAEYRGDAEAIVLRVDLERALRSKCMSPKQRQAVALYYFAQLTQEECAKLLNVTQEAVTQRLSNAIANIAKHMQGEDVTTPQYIRHDDYTDIDHEFDMWMAQVLVGHGGWWELRDEVLDALNRVLGMPQRINTQQEDTEYTYILSNESLRPKQEVLMEEPYIRPKPITKTQKYYGSIWSEQDDDYDKQEDESHDRRTFYVRLPNDRNVKRYGLFWTERK